VLRYDRLGRVATNFWFAFGENYPSNSVEYYYNVLGQLTNITERSGTDASSTYVAASGLGNSDLFAGRWPLTQRAAAVLARVPQQGQGALSGLLLLALAAMWTLSAKRQQLALALRGASPTFQWKRTGVRKSLFSALCAFCTPKAFGAAVKSPTPRRFRLPAVGWRLSTALTIIALLFTDPRLDFWSLHAACAYPSNPSNETTRVTTFAYDLDGHLTQVNCPEGVINYDYDPATGRHTSTCTTNSYVAYGYDKLGRLETVTVSKRHGVPLATNEVTTYHYDQVGNRASVSLPNGIVSTYFYDSLNRLTNLTHTHGTSLLASYSYQLHPTGRRTNAVEILKTEETATPYITNALSWAYDQMYRLTNEVSVSTASGGYGTYTNAYQYDKVGNRLSRVHIQGSTTTTVTNLFNDNDQLLKEVTLENGNATQTTWYGYDQNGSLIARTNVAGSTSTVLYGYDLKNKLSTVTKLETGETSSFLYNDAGIRVRSTAGTAPTHYLIDANNHTGYAQVLEELSAPGAIASRSYVIGDEVLAQCGGTVDDARYFLADGHGSNRQLSRPDATVGSHYNYDAYGVTLDSSTRNPETLTTKLYCGEQFDSSLQMYNLRARYYDPGTGRFNALDTFRGSNQDPQSLHKYAYCHLDPINGFDPSGHSLLTEILASTLIRSILFSMAIGFPFHVYHAVKQWKMGVDLSTILYDFALSVTIDAALGAALPGLGSWVSRSVVVGRVVQMGGSVVGRAANSVWNLTPFARGRAIEQLTEVFGGRLASTIRDGVMNFPVIDDFFNGVATSIKSIDLLARTYQVAGNVTKRVLADAGKLARFRGATWGGITVAEQQIEQRVLVVYMEEGATSQAQIQELITAVQQAKIDFPFVQIAFKFIP
jgi:RHS repeat-associated protein